MTLAIIIGVVVLVGIGVAVLLLRKATVPSLPDEEVPRMPSAPPRAAEGRAGEPGRVPSAAPPPPKRPPPVTEGAAAARGEEPEAAMAVSVQPLDEHKPSPKPPPAPPPKRKKDVKGLRRGLAKVRESEGMFGRLLKLFTGRKEIDPSVAEELEEILLSSDVGVRTTASLLDGIRASLARKELADADRVWAALRTRATELLDLAGGGALRFHGKPTVVLMVGVNGTGKTTTIGKLASKLKDQGKKVLVVAADTFRAAAVDQLVAWGKRIGCDVFAREQGADPAAVVFDAVKQASESGVDFVLVDTAGRLHTKQNLMDELGKVARTAGKALEGAPHETLLVVDGTTGQNALEQASQFGEALPLTGIVLTKLDGTAKGGVVLAIAAEHKLPVRYIGTGERAQDLRDFDAEEFVEAMLGQGDDAAQAA